VDERTAAPQSRFEQLDGVRPASQTTAKIELELEPLKAGARRAVERRLLPSSSGLSSPQWL